MPRMSKEKSRIESERLNILHHHQRDLRKRLQKETKVKKAGVHLPGEEKLKKEIAVFLKVGIPKISYTEIANRLGEPKNIIKNWFRNDPEVKDLYDYTINNLRGSALDMVATYALEAIETQVLLMRFGSEKYMFEASKEILRSIIPEISRKEIETESTKKHEWGDRDELLKDIRQLAPKEQEAAVEALERFEELLAGNEDKLAGDEGQELKPINSSDEDDDDEED